MKFLFILITFYTLSFAQTPFTLTKFKSLYPMVEIYTDKVPDSYKVKITKILKEYTDELGINTKGYSDRPLVIMISRIAVGDKLTLKMALIIGEEVKRLDDGAEVFAITYQKVDIFEVEDLDEDLIDTVEYLLELFKEQYIEDNE
ncbi:hypothetical protein [Sulfurimonas sp.]|jgi:hypothetical protein|uniref:hypothetical protein n=1 Tax=Sulfurimonas sp. TaxID=2022749 RepID=UPI0025F7C3EB|nr:hypothetical protein [Sulfurimonas sp.]MBT5935754.1 hypothetical protein [Sulfurimonas sp.]